MEEISPESAIRMRGIGKRFPGVIANENVDLEVHKGEVYSLLGENGAGKSTLMKILYGFHQPDSVEIFLNGMPVKFSSPADTINDGICSIHQQFMLIPTLTMAENVALGLRSSRAL